MNHDWEETKLKALFHELRQEDELRAPSFASVWDAALERRVTTGQPRHTFRLVVVTAGMLVLLGCTLLVFFKQLSSQPAQTTVTSEASPIIRSEPPSAIFQVPALQSKVSPKARKPLANRALEATPGREHARLLRRRISARQPNTELISQWRSPTLFLLESPGDQLLKTVPLLGETSLEIKAMTP